VRPAKLDRRVSAMIAAELDGVWLR
jgi:hypothetical protein